MENCKEHHRIKSPSLCPVCLVFERNNLQSDLAALQEQTRWVPVAERLPEDGGLYLLTKDFDKGEDMWLDIMGSGSSGFKTIKDYIDLHKITHWKEIQLPKE